MSKKTVLMAIFCGLISILFVVSSVSGQTEQWKYKTDDNVACVSISANGEYVVAGTETSEYGGDVFFLDNNGTLLWNKHFDDEIGGVSVSGDGSAVLVTISEWFTGDPDTFLYDKDGNLVWQKDLVSGSWAIDIAISDDGNYIVVGDVDNKVYLCDKNGNELWTYTLGDWATAVDLSHDAEYIVAGSWDEYIYLFAKNGTLLWDFRLPDQISYKSVSISNDSNCIVAGYNSFDENIACFDIVGNSLWNISTGDYIIHGVSVAAEGGFTAVGSSQDFCFLDENGNILWRHEARNFVNDASITPDGSKVAAGSEDTYIYYISSGYVVSEFPSFLILPLFMIATLLTTIIYKRKRTANS